MYDTRGARMPLCARASGAFVIFAFCRVLHADVTPLDAAADYADDERMMPFA